MIAAHALAAWAFAAAAAFLLLAAHPFVTYPLSLALLRRARPRPLEMQPMAAPPSVAVCVCAYNEAGVIGDRVRNILSLRPSCPGLQALVYVDGANDGTADILRGFGAEITAVISPQRLGKTHGMNTLVGLTQADIIVFSDANVSFAPDAITRLVAPFADPAVGCVCGHLRYLAADGHTAATGSLYWRLEEHIKALESATGSVMGADGSIFAIRRALHVPPPANLIDDMYVSLAILCGGARIVRAADAVAYEASVSTTAEEFRRKIRIACQAFNVHRALATRLARLPAVDLYKYVSHKVLRWLSIFSLAASFACAAAGVAAWGGAAWLAGFLLLCGLAGGMLGAAPRGPAARLREVLLALVATGLGVIRSLRGEKFQTWTPPASARAAADLTPEPV